MKLLILKKFNNYFNRKIIKYDNLDDYASHSAASLTINSYNFNPNDGVRTDVVLGRGDKGLDAFFDFETTKSADYLVAYSTETIHNGDEPDVDVNTIESRWFITEVKRTRGGQYAIQLKRDSIADNLDTLINCPAFIQKGICRDDSPLILNDEGITVNQIKSAQEFIKDETTSAWIVGYMPRDAGKDDPISAQVADADADYVTIENLADELDVSSSDLSAALTNDTEHPTSFVKDNVEVVGWINWVNMNDEEIKLVAGSQNNFQSFTYNKGIKARRSGSKLVDCFAKTIDNPDRPTNDRLAVPELTVLSNFWKQYCQANISTIKNNWETYTGKPLFTRNVLDKLNELVDNGTLIYKQGSYYRLRVNSVSNAKNTGENLYAAATDVPFSAICSNTISAWNSWAEENSPYYDQVNYWYELLQSLAGGKIFLVYNEILSNFYLEKVSNDVTVPGVSFTMSSTRNSCLDQTFDMFAIPYSNVEIKNGVDTYEGIGQYAQQLAVDIALNMPESKELYDLQLLPYCPIEEIVGDGKIDITGLTAGYDYDWITYTGSITSREEQNVYAESSEYEPGMYEGLAEWQSNINDADVISWGYVANAENQDQEAQEILRDWEATNNASKTSVGGKAKFMVYGQIQDPQTFDHADINVGFWVTYTETVTNQKKSIVIYPKKSSFSRSVGKAITAQDEMKIENLCNKYRLISPNYQGGFDFNLAKNLGYCNGFTAYCTYKPYTPYIRVVPKFNWLYGGNYNKEARGLVVNGDFSLGRVNSAWESYQLQNKNYQNIFNREMQNLDVNQGIQRTQQYVAGGINIANAAGQGAVTGAIAGGGVYGAIAGGIIGGAASGIGYGVDNALLERSMAEQKAYSQDKFHLQLGNIQAIPYTLTKVSAFDIDSAIFPLLEYYTCTDEEKTYLRNKFKYEGYTIGVVDDLGQYITIGSGNYVQANLIRNDYIIDDPHQLDDINNELLKGVYM